MASRSASLFALVLALAAVATADAAVSCGTVVSDVAGCIPFARSGGIPSPACCAGLRSLNSQATTMADRQAVCGCLKTLVAGNNAAGLNPDNIAALPSQCGVKVPYPIRQSTDCSRIH